MKFRIIQVHVVEAGSKLEAARKLVKFDTDSDYRTEQEMNKAAGKPFEVEMLTSAMEEEPV